MKSLAFVLLLAATVLSQSIEVPTDKCTWRGAGDGQMHVCESNEIVVGSCGSGRRAKCSGQFHELLCCVMPEYTYDSCADHNGGHGEHLSCPELNKDPGSLLEGACGSGLGKDCNHEVHAAKCCRGYLGTKKLQSGGECYWVHGDHGQKVQCNRHDEAVFGRCGSGALADCGHGQFHGIQCCPLIAVD